MYDGVVECSLSQFSMESAAVARAFCDDAVGLRIAALVAAYPTDA